MAEASTDDMIDTGVECEHEPEDDTDEDRVNEYKLFANVDGAFAFIRDHEERTDTRFITIRSREKGQICFCFNYRFTGLRHITQCHLSIILSCIVWLMFIVLFIFFPKFRQ